MNSNKVLVTGGSGFIGTNLIDLLCQMDYSIINYDINQPKKREHNKYWKQIDVLDRVLLRSELNKDKPDYIIHLAARTDLKGSSLKDYQTNIDGVKNIMDGIGPLDNLKRIILASSMLVCKRGHHIKSLDDYNPPNFYGQSKVLGELVIKKYDLDWVIVRPTSIWGPWFSEPYRNFFELSIKRLFIKLENKNSSTKTFGYVKNTCKQIFHLLHEEFDSMQEKIFYLGDSPPINISGFTDVIRSVNKQNKALVIPKYILSLLATIGDTLNILIGKDLIPINKFRYKNMTEDNIISNKLMYMPNMNEGSLENNVQETLEWIYASKEGK